MDDPPLDIALFVGGPDMQGAPANPSDAPKRWRRMAADALIWRRDAWRHARGAAEVTRGAGPALGFVNEFIAARPGALGVIKAIDADDAAAQTRAATAARACRVICIVWMDAPALVGDAERLRVLLNAPDLPTVLCLPADEVVEVDAIRVETDSAPRLQDNMLSLIGALRIGRRAAKAIIAAGHSAQPVRQWLWDSPRYQAWYEGPQGHPLPAAVMVSLPNAIAGDGFEIAGFGQSYFAKRSVPCIYVRTAKSLWFQDTEILAVADAIRAFAGPETRIVTYGASMGAYGALMLSGRLRAEKVIAAAPQYSIDRSVIAERRWRDPSREIGRFVHDLDAMVAPDARKVVLYDRLSLDRAQIDRFQIDTTWQVLNFPFASHQVLDYLREVGALGHVLADCLGKGPDIDALRRDGRAGRRRSQHYWAEMAKLAAPRHSLVALYALDQLETFGGFKRRIRMMREDIAAQFPNVAGR